MNRLLRNKFLFFNNSFGSGQFICSQRIPGMLESAWGNKKFPKRFLLR